MLSGGSSVTNRYKMTCTIINLFSFLVHFVILIYICSLIPLVWMEIRWAVARKLTSYHFDHLNGVCTRQRVILNIGRGSRWFELNDDFLTLVCISSSVNFLWLLQRGRFLAFHQSEVFTQCIAYFYFRIVFSVTLASFPGGFVFFTNLWSCDGLTCLTTRMSHCPRLTYEIWVWAAVRLDRRERDWQSLAFLDY